MAFCLSFGYVAFTITTGKVHKLTDDTDNKPLTAAIAVEDGSRKFEHKWKKNSRFKNTCCLPTAENLFVIF